MKLSTQWKTLNRDQRRAWNAWAKSNPVLLDDGSFRRVSGHKAMTMVLRNRTLAGDALNPSALPAAATWLDGSLSTRDAGPFTVGGGYIGFRAEQDLAAGTKWFVWASAPILATEPQPLATLRFITVLAPGALSVSNHDVTPSIGSVYLQVHGDWRPPDNPDQEPYPYWDPPRKIWFRLHHYMNGQLSPGRISSGNIIRDSE